MPSAKKVTVNKSSSKPEMSKSSVSMQSDLTSRIQQQFENNQSYLSLVLGLLIVFVIGILVFNYIKKHNQPNLIPADQTTNQTADITPSPAPDVAVDQLPGQYTIKAGDTLFNIAKKYYNDGYKFPELVKANKIANENKIEVGQVLDIPKLDTQTAMATSSASPDTVQQIVGDTSNTPVDMNSTGTGGADNVTVWGDKITSDTYTIQKGDWLSKISGRAYGDIMKYKDLAAANNIPNPNKIEPGMVIKIPR